MQSDWIESCARSAPAKLQGAVPLLAVAGLVSCQLTLDDRPEPGLPLGDLRAVGATGAEGVAQPYRFDRDTASGTQQRNQSWSSDCEDPLTMSAFEDVPGQETALRVIGVSEQTHDLGQEFPPRGEVVVNLFRRGRSVLVLSGYDQIHWTIHLGAGAELVEVFVSGFSRHTVTAPAGVPVYNQSGDRGLPYSALSWFGDIGDPEATELVIGMRAVTGLPLTSFHGCPRMSQLTLFEEAPIGCDAAPIDGAGCSGTVLARGTLGSGTADTPQRQCARSAILGGTCCSAQSEDWLLTDGAPTLDGGLPAVLPRAAWPCTR